MLENSDISKLQKELEDVTQQKEKLEGERHTLRAQQILQLSLTNEVNNIDFQHHFLFGCYVSWDIFVVQTKYSSNFGYPIKLPQIQDVNPEARFFGEGNLSYHTMIYRFIRTTIIEWHFDCGLLLKCIWQNCWICLTLKMLMFSFKQQKW